MKTMGLERQSPPKTDQMLGGKEVLEGPNALRHPERVARLGDCKKRSRDMGRHILRVSEEAAPMAYQRPEPDNVLSASGELVSPEGESLGKLAREVLSCANYLVFHNYYTVDQIRLAKITTCKKHLLCPVCARIRAAKQVSRYLERLEIIKQTKRLRPALLTLTVKNGDDLEERFKHLQDSWRKYQAQRRDFNKKGRGFNELCKVSGAVFSYEVTNRGNGWHPHLHAVVLLDDWIDQGQLSAEWEKITGDSYVVDIREIKKDPVEGFLEVFKYALKFSELSLDHNLDAYRVLKGRRLQGSFGDFHGVEVPETMTDDLLDDLPYLEMFYKFSAHKGGYDLETVTEGPALCAGGAGTQPPETLESENPKILESKPDGGYTSSQVYNSTSSQVHKSTCAPPMPEGHERRRTESTRAKKVKPPETREAARPPPGH